MSWPRRLEKDRRHLREGVARDGGWTLSEYCNQIEFFRPQVAFRRRLVSVDLGEYPLYLEFFVSHCQSSLRARPRG